MGIVPFHQSAPTRDPFTRPINRIAVREVDAETDDAVALIDPPAALFFFLGHPVATGQIDASWTTEKTFRDDWVYVRTRSGVYRTFFRSIENLAKQLFEDFEIAHQGILVNLREVVKVETGRVNRRRAKFVIRSEPSVTEWVTVSRGCWPTFRRRLGIPDRTPRAPKRPAPA